MSAFSSLFGSPVANGSGGGGSLPSLSQYQGWQGDATSTAVEVPWLSQNIARSLSVAPVSGVADHSTIASALTAAAALTPTVASPVAIYVFPGTYTVTTTTAIPDNVAVISVFGPQTTVISTTTFLVSGMFTIGNNSALIGFGISSTGAATGNVFDLDPGAGLPVYLDNLEVTCAGRILDLNTASSSVRIGKLRAVTTVGGDPFVITGAAGMTLQADQLYIERSGGSCNSAIFAGNDSVVTIGQLQAIGCGNTGMLRAQDTAVLRVLNGFGVAGSTSQSVLSNESATATIVVNIGVTGYLQANIIRAISIGTNNLGILADLDAPDDQLNVLNELAVGTPLEPRKASFGTGDSTPRYMTVLEGDPGLGFTNVTATAAAPTGTFNAFRSATINEGLYIGGTTQFVAFKANGITTAIAGGVLVFEYWNGSAWTAFNIMVVDDRGPYNQYAENIFGRVTSGEHVYLDIDTISATWASTSVNSITAYWIRIRQTTVVTTIPVLTQLKLHYNSANISEEGAITYYGDGRPVRTIPAVHLRLTIPVQGATPLNENLDFSAAIDLIATDNEFANGAIDRIGGVIQIPEGIDTSARLTFRLVWAIIGTNTGDVDWRLITNNSPIGSTLQGAGTEVTNQQIVTVGAAADDVTQATEFTVDISDLLPGSLLAFVVERNTADDTLADNVYAVSLQASAKYWKG